MAAAQTYHPSTAIGTRNAQNAHDGTVQTVQDWEDPADAWREVEPERSVRNAIRPVHVGFCSKAPTIDGETRYVAIVSGDGGERWAVAKPFRAFKLFRNEITPLLEKLAPGMGRLPFPAPSAIHSLLGIDEPIIDGVHAWLAAVVEAIADDTVADLDGFVSAERALSIFLAEDGSVSDQLVAKLGLELRLRASPRPPPPEGVPEPKPEPEPEPEPQPEPEQDVGREIGEKYLSLNDQTPTGRAVGLHYINMAAQAEPDDVGKEVGERYLAEAAAGSG